MHTTSTMKNGVSNDHAVHSTNGEHYSKGAHVMHDGGLSDTDYPLPIAVVGLGMRLPGGIHTAGELWQTLMNKRSTRCEIPRSRFSVEGFHSSSARPGSVAMRHGHFLADTDDLHHLDTSFYSMGINEIKDIDPQQRMLLEVVYECLESSGQVDWRGSNIGCWVGVWGEDWLDLHSKDVFDSGTYRVSGGHDFAISNRISYEYNLKGPSYTIKAGCSSSLIALHEAVRALRAGDCDGAIVAGTNLIFSPTMSMAMTEQGVLSPDASCKSFDANANGYARGEAINAIYLKRLSTALQEGDPIQAVVRGTSTNSDGKTPGMSMPSSESHVSLIKRAYEEAGLDPHDTVFVEAHGTGTPVGDPLEAIAIAHVFGGRPDRTLYLGSVKPNLGHSEGASGISSMFKAILAIQNRTIPPNINFTKPNPKIPFAESNMKVACDALPWPAHQRLRASVNSFGIGGANAHCIVESLEQYLNDNPPPEKVASSSNRINGVNCGKQKSCMNGYGGMTASNGTTKLALRGHVGIERQAVMESNSQTRKSVQKSQQILNGLNCTKEAPRQPRKVLYVLSAANTASLKLRMLAHQKYNQDHRSNAVDIAHTLCNRREHLLHRTYAVTPTVSPSHEPPAALNFSRLAKVSNTQTPQVVMVFTGQGAQWAGMAKEMLEDYPVFYDTIKGLGTVLSQLENGPTWDLLEELSRQKESSRVGEAEFSQPLVCAVQLALVDLLRHVGLSPDAVVGHSSGEIGAAYASGAITSAEAITIAYYRGYVNRSLTRTGGMAAIGLGSQQIAPYLADGVVVACENSPHSVTLSGEKDILQGVCEKIRKEEPDCLVRELKVQIAYHSHHMQDIGEMFQSLLDDKVHSKAPVVPFFSSVRVERIQASGSLDASYWRENLERPVQFNAAVQKVLNTQIAGRRSVFVEIGPHSALAGPLRQIFKAHGSNQAAYASALVRGKDSVESVLSLVGDLFLEGILLNLFRVSPAGVVVTDLPLYPWNHEKEYWTESRVSRDWRFRKYPNHELLGSQTLECSKLQPEWRNVLKLENVPWLRDHQILDDVIFPCAGYLAMAVEAVRQATESSAVESFSLRNVIVRSALVITDSKPAEVLTTLQPVRLTNTLNSSWWEFSIMSYNGSSWQKHCDGQVRTGCDAHQKKAASSQQACPKSSKKYVRPVENLYPELHRLGLRYGPSFQGLEDVRCEPNSTQALARLIETTVSESSYAIHPTTIDHCLQIFFPACCEGIFYRSNKLCVPTAIGNLQLVDGKAREIQGASIEADATISAEGTILGAAQVVSTVDGVALLSLEGAKFSPLDSGDDEDADDAIAAAQLVWKPHLDFANMHDLIRPNQGLVNDRQDLDLVERLTLVAIVVIKQRMESVSSPTDLGHLAMFRKWIDCQAADLTKSDLFGLGTEVDEITSMAPGDRLALVQELRQKIMQSGAASAAILIGRIIDRCDEILEGTIEGIEVLQAEDGLTNYYNYVESRTDSIDFFAAAGHTRPTIRVLEIGAGTGGSSQVILKGLTNSDGERLYSTYAYTDISAGFFVAARERFKAYSNLDFKVLDITKDPLEQGFEAESFDLIIAGNVLHATPFLADTLRNVRKLLAPQGYLFLQELSPKMHMVNLIMGILPGWWLGVVEGRSTEPYLPPAQWNVALKQAGFSGVDSVIYDAPRPYHINANIISRPAPKERVDSSTSSSTLAAPDRVQRHGRAVLLHRAGDEATESAQLLQSILAQRGFTSRWVHLAEHKEIYTEKHDIIISILDLQAPFLATMSAADFTAIQSVLTSLGRTPMLWVMPSAQGNVGPCHHPGYGLSLGLLRTVRNERSVAILTVEIDSFDDVAFSAVAKLATKWTDGLDISKGSNASGMDPDWEFVVSEGKLKTGRYHPVRLSRELAAQAPEPEAVTLEIGRAGLLQTLKWVGIETRAPKHDEVVVEPRCVGMNFRDVLVCMGIVEAKDIGIGLEGSGIIAQVGSGVHGLRPGDRVFYLADKCFSTQITISAQRCAKIPSSLSYEQAATMPCVYATVIHSLLDMGGLRSGQSILIHSACGGIGIAALNVCKNVPDLEIYVTVGSADKVQYLMETYGLARTQIFHSRDTSFLHDVRAATGGRGVDLVLNSLSGELLHASWQCVAPYGKMLEIGKRDFMGKARLEMDRFEANRSFIGIDLARFDGARCRRLLQRTADMFSAGAVQPIEPLQVFSATEVEASFRHMQKGTHLGKIVVTIPEKGQGLAATRQAPPTVLHPRATYVLVGGLGGLGRAVASWLVDKGARQLVFLSRSAGRGARDQAFLEELQRRGCAARAVAGDVTRLGDVQRALAAAPGDRPVKGILQMSMVLRDKAFVDMDLDDWQAAVQAKTQGTWNLHVAAPRDLDFFVASGSISGAFGMPGQANYAAGNTYLTALGQLRRARGLPASVLHIGLMEDVGYLAENPARAQALRAAGGFFLRTRQLLAAMDWALAPRKPPPLDAQLTIGLRCDAPLADPANRVLWKKDARMALYHNQRSQHRDAANHDDDDADGTALRLLVASIDADPGLLDAPATAQLVTRAIGTRIYTFMLHPTDDMDTTASLASLGVDSLVTIELRNWIKRTFAGLECSTLEILDARTIDGLAKLTLDALRARCAAPAAAPQGHVYLEMKAP